MFSRFKNWLSRALGGQSDEAADQQGGVAVLDPPDGEAEGFDPGSTVAVEDYGQAEQVDLSPGEEEPEPPPLPTGWWDPPVEPQDDPLDRRRDVSIDGFLRDRLSGILKDPELELPRMAGVTQRALMILRNPDELDYKRLAGVVEQDATVTTEILRVANSPLYRGVNKFTQLSQVFARLGTRHLETIFVSMSVKGLAIRIGKEYRTLGEELWQRSVAAGVTASRLGELFGRDPDELFLYGLLHDIGELAILQVVHEYHKNHGRPITRSLFEQIADEWHGHIGLRLADHWNLPDPLPELIGQHHKLPEDDDPLRQYRLILQVADAAAFQLGYGGREWQRDFFNIPAVRFLGLEKTVVNCEALADLPERIEARLETL